MFSSSHPPPSPTDAPILVPSISTDLMPTNSPLLSTPTGTAPASDTNPAPFDPPLRKSSRTQSKPAWHSDYAMTTTLASLPATPTPVSFSYSCFLAHTLQTKDPLHFKHAVIHPQWVAAMNDELNSLELNNT
ncbi:unnamed protein product [Amaranthus hypochondriacus]